MLLYEYILLHFGQTTHFLFRLAHCFFPTSCLIGTKLGRADKQVGAMFELAPRNVARYVRLSELNESLLNRVDNDEIGLYPAVSLSYLKPDEQAELNQILNENSYKINMKKAELLRVLSSEKKLTGKKMAEILSGEFSKKPKLKTSPPLKIKAKIYQRYFGEGTTPSEMEKTIDTALAEYFENHK